MEGCNLARTCPSNCIFLFLCFLAIFYYRDVIFKPNPLYPKKWALNLALKLLWNHSLTTLSVVTNNAMLTLALLSFSTFLQIVSFDGVNVCSTCLDPFSFLYFIFLLHDFISNFFLQCFYLNITKYWFDVTTCELKYSIKGYLPCILLVGNIGRDNRLVNFATFGFALE
jgi:hypothetical protein